MVTREEEHTTRGRAHALWEMLHGDVIQNGWHDEHVKDALDLCLSCKGCKGDCPVNVDMATYKAEFLSHYWEGRIRPRYAYGFGWIDKWARLASAAPGFVNLFTQLPGIRAVSKAVMGIPQKREIPPFAPYTFKSWFAKRPPRNEHAPKVILWPDTFNNYFFPETAQAAVEVLENSGFQVVVPQQHLCCGRPLYDYGFLDMAKSYLLRVMDALGPEIEAGTPVVALEPSCCSVFRDELNGMFPDSPMAHKLMEQTFTLGEFLEKKANGYVPPRLPVKAIIHGHCHHKAIMRIDDEESLLKKMGIEYQFLDSGCCGMAGSFGYEKDKYDVSIKAGERYLLPEVRKAGIKTIVVADGFSCKEQIHQETNRHALHLAEVVQLGLHNKADQPYPEREIVEKRRRRLRASMLRAAVVTGAVFTVGGLLLSRMYKNR
jgi:Fe-S oxidoreductase